MSEPNVIDEYVAGHTGDHRQHMTELCAHIRSLVPADTEERLSWGMPTFKVGGRNLVHFAAGKKHVGFHPGGDGVQHVADELQSRGLKFSKGSIQFPLSKPLPLDLVTRVVEFRLAQEADR